MLSSVTFALTGKHILVFRSTTLEAPSGSSLFPVLEAVMEMVPGATLVQSSSQPQANKTEAEGTGSCQKSR